MDIITQVLESSKDTYARREYYNNLIAEQTINNKYKETIYITLDFCGGKNGNELLMYHELNDKYYYIIDYTYDVPCDNYSFDIYRFNIENDNILINGYYSEMILQDNKFEQELVDINLEKFHDDIVPILNSPNLKKLVNKNISQEMIKEMNDIIDKMNTMSFITDNITVIPKVISNKIIDYQLKDLKYND